MMGTKVILLTVVLFWPATQCFADVVAQLEQGRQSEEQGKFEETQAIHNQVAAEAVKTRDGKLREERCGRAVIWRPKDGWAEEDINGKEEMVLGLPIKIRREQKGHTLAGGVPCIRYVNDRVTDVTKLISLRDGAFPALEICYPSDPRDLLLAAQKQPHEILHDPTFHEIDSICSGIWRCSNEIVRGNSFRVSLRAAPDRKESGRT